MAQISKGDTFTDGQQVTGARLNQLVDSASLLAGAITDQPNITAGTVASGDSVLLYDLSATALREANVSDVLGSNVPVVTSSITAGNTNDILITPNDGVIVSGLAYTSGDGLTVTVTSAAHTLAVGQVILIAGAGTGYNGTFRVATILTNSFTYVMTTAATAGSGTLNYTKKGLVKNPANKSIAGNLYVDGSAVIAGATLQTGDVTQTGSVTQTGTVTNSGTLTSSGTANFTGTSTAVTQTSTDNSTNVATTAFVSSAIPIKAWVSFNGTGTVAIRSSFNVTSVTDNGTGDYTVNFTTPMTDINYGVLATCMRTSGNTGAQAFVLETTSPTTSAVRVGTTNQGGTFVDSAYVTVVIYR